jgi:hypothetical protein
VRAVERGVMAFALFAVLAAAPIALSQVPRQPIVLAPSGLRVMVFEKNDRDAAAWNAIRDLGANVVAILGPPSAEIDALAKAAGMTYLAFLTTDEIALLSRDASRISEIRSERALAGFYYYDSQALEGFTTPEVQRQAYSTLKLLFPDKLVLNPTRLDPIAWSPDYLDRYFRPEFTDLVAPYFYPVGATILGEAREEDAWRDRLAGLLSALAPRVPEGRQVLPVLQGFEVDGYPVSSRFLGDQLGVYRGIWPDVSGAVVFAWTIAEVAPFVEIADSPDLQAGACMLFSTLSRASGCRSRSVIPWR